MTRYSLPDNYVMSLYKDPQGRLWVGTNGGGLAMYDHRQDRFLRVPTGEKALAMSPSIPSPAINVVVCG